jgi:hypothetical protein
MPIELEPPVELPPPAPAPAEPASPAEPGPSASAFFHDLTKLRAMEGVGVVPRAKDAPAQAPPPEEQVDLERFAALSAAFDEPDAARTQRLADEGIELGVWRKAVVYWRKALAREQRRGERALRDRFDDAYVRAWEALHPDRFGVAAYARLRRAEERGMLQAEVDDQGIDPTMAMRLRRVWRRRVAADEALGAEVDEAMAALG